MNTEIARREGVAVEIYHGWTPEALQEAIDREKELRQKIIDYYRSVMQKGHHYYELQEGQKPALSKEGALNLASLFKVKMLPLEPHETYFPDGHYTVRYRVDLVNASGEVIATGDGLCTTRESKYAYRWGYESDIPSNIDRNQLITRNRKSKSGGTYLQYKLPNQDLPDLWNTCLKMALKRAIVDGVLKLPLASELFTQDLEEQLQERVAQQRQVREPQDKTEEVEEEEAPAQPTIAEINELIEFMGRAYAHDRAIIRAKIREAMEIPARQSLTNGQIRSGMTMIQHDKLKADATKQVQSHETPVDMEDDVGDFSGPSPDTATLPQNDTQEQAEGIPGSTDDASLTAADRSHEADTSDAAMGGPAQTPAPESAGTSIEVLDGFPDVEVDDEGFVTQQGITRLIQKADQFGTKAKLRQLRAEEPRLTLGRYRYCWEQVGKK